jgi:hypothetical protein
MPSVFTLTCQCGARSLVWQDHAPTCTFARYGKARERARTATRRLVWLALFYAGLLVGIALGVTILR